MKGLGNRISRFGGFNYVTAILLLMAITAGVGGYFLGPVYYAEWTWRRGVVSQMINASNNDDWHIRDELTTLAEQLKIPITSDDSYVRITRYAGDIRIEYKYVRETPIPYFDSIEFVNDMKRKITDVYRLGP